MVRNHFLKYAYPGGGVTAHIFSELPQVLISLSCKISKQKHSSMYFKLIYFLGQNVFLEKYLSMIKRWEKLVPAQAQGMAQRSRQMESAFGELRAQRENWK